MQEVLLKKIFKRIAGNKYKIPTNLEISEVIKQAREYSMKKGKRR
jgi:hypothetical protein